MVRLLKPLEYYHEKYGSWMYGLNKLYLLMEKQHNRGQEGAGLACVKFRANAGEEYMFRERAVGTGASYRDICRSSRTLQGFNPRATQRSAIRQSQPTFRRRALYGPPPLQYHRKIRNLLYPSFFYDAITGVQRTLPFAEIST